MERTSATGSSSTDSGLERPKRPGWSHDAILDNPDEVDELLKAMVEDGRRSSAGSHDSESRFSDVEVRSLASILSDPDALRGPEPVVERFAWRGRSTLLAGREKSGKSTLASAMAAAVSSGRPFLDAATPQGTVLYLALEEHLHDVAARFVDFRADPNKLFVEDRIRPIDELEAVAGKLEPLLVIVDTLSAFTERLGLRPGNASDWTPVMGRFTRLCRDSNAALLLLHHGRKSDGTYRDSTAIGAGVDVLLELDEEDECTRRIRARARWPIETFSARLTGTIDRGDDPLRYELAAGEMSLEARVLQFIERNGGRSTRNVRDAVTGRSLEISAALGRLEATGAIRNDSTSSASRWFLVED